MADSEYCFFKEASQMNLKFNSYSDLCLGEIINCRETATRKSDYQSMFANKKKIADKYRDQLSLKALVEPGPEDKGFMPSKDATLCEYPFT
jgi:hypothetical protein